MTRDLVLMVAVLLLVGCIFGAIAGGGLSNLYHFLFR